MYCSCDTRVIGVTITIIIKQNCVFCISTHNLILSVTVYYIVFLVVIKS